VLSQLPVIHPGGLVQGLDRAPDSIDLARREPCLARIDLGRLVSSCDLRDRVPRDEVQQAAQTVSYTHEAQGSIRGRRRHFSATASAQPSGISFLPDGRRALVANRAGGTVSVLSVDGLSVEIIQTVEVCEPEESASDVAVHPNGKLALVSVQKGGYLRVLEIGADSVLATERKLSVYGEPYRCVITPDGALGLTAGAGQGNGLDNDAVQLLKNRRSPIGLIMHLITYFFGRDKACGFQAL